jgi:hypothetical protein
MEMSRSRTTSAFDAENNPLLNDAVRDLAAMSIEGRAQKDREARRVSPSAGLTHTAKRSGKWRAVQNENDKIYIIDIIDI